MKFACGISVSFVARYYLRDSVAKSPANSILDMSIQSSRTHARVQCFSIFAFTSSPFGCKVLIKCELRVKASPFCLHLFFAMEVVQGIELQVVAVKVKVKAGFAFTLNRLIYSLLRGEVKGEGKNGKFAESASAYMRVGACPARRIEWDFVRGREV